MVTKNPAYNHLFKIIIVGSSPCGKSSLLTRFTDNRFSPDYDKEVGVAFWSRIVKLGKNSVKLQIWDTSTGSELFYSTVVVAYYRNMKGVILAFDLTSPDSFKWSDRVFQDVEKHADKGTKLIVVGCKADMIPERKVSYEEAAEKAMQHDAAYVETSAKTGENVEEAFRTLAELIMSEEEAMMRDQEDNEKQKQKGVLARLLGKVKGFLFGTAES